MTKHLSISEARRLLPSLVHHLSRHPDEVFHISVRNQLVAELKAPPQIAKKGQAAGLLLALARSRRTVSRKPGRTSWKVSQDIDSHLYP
jgi:hypothetical protein